MKNKTIKQLSTLLISGDISEIIVKNNPYDTVEHYDYFKISKTNEGETLFITKCNQDGSRMALEEPRLIHRIAKNKITVSIYLFGKFANISGKFEICGYNYKKAE